jgi:acetolactate synthase I/II/III large subunit
MVKVSDVIVQYLKANNIDIVFGIIGSANSHIFNSILEEGSIKLVSVHHEQAAVMAMGAYYRSTGKMAVALVTAGGGASNASTGILSNWADSIPGIIISGQEQSYYLNEYRDMRMFGVQGYDAVTAYYNCTKTSQVITETNLHILMPFAFALTQEGRPGPVFLEVPFDTQSKMIEEVEIRVTPITEIYPELSSDTDYILSALSQAERPVILGGHGVKLAKAEELFKQFIGDYNIPTVLSWSAVDLLDDKDPNYFGRPGVQGQRAANFIVQNSDLLIVLGSRLSLLQTGYKREDFAPYANIIHVDIDDTEINKFNGKNIKADVGELLTSLNSKWKAEIKIEEWITYCNQIKEKYPLVMPEHLADPTNSYTFIDKFSQKVSDNYTIVTDMGTALLSGFYGWRIKPNQKMFTSLGLGEMGYGLAAAVGAGFGDRPVMCLNCDGGMMMNIQELQTIKTHNLPVKIIIFNNDGYLMIKHTQNMLFKGARTCVDKETGVTLPDYKKVAHAFDFEYFTEDKIDDFLAFEGQAIIEVFMNPDQEFIPKVRGMKLEDNTIQAGLLEEMSPLLPLEEIEQAMFVGINQRSKTVIR